MNSENGVTHTECFRSYRSNCVDIMGSMTVTQTITKYILIHTVHLYLYCLLLSSLNIEFSCSFFHLSCLTTYIYIGLFSLYLPPCNSVIVIIYPFVWSRVQVPRGFLHFCLSFRHDRGTYKHCRIPQTTS